MATKGSREVQKAIDFLATVTRSGPHVYQPQDLVPAKFNPTRRSDPKKSPTMKFLTAAIKEEGMSQQPILGVRFPDGKVHVGDGHRRRQAAIDAKTTASVIVYDGTSAPWFAKKVQDALFLVANHTQKQHTARHNLYSYLMGGPASTPRTKRMGDALVAVYGTKKVQEFAQREDPRVSPTVFSNSIRLYALEFGEPAEGEEGYINPDWMKETIEWMVGTEGMQQYIKDMLHRDTKSALRARREKYTHVPGPALARRKYHIRPIREVKRAAREAAARDLKAKGV